MHPRNSLAIRLSILFTGLLASLAAARSIEERAAPKLVLSHYMLGDITEEHAPKDIADTIAMGYADDLVSKGGKFKLALSLDLYATGTWCYDKKLGKDCGGPKEYETSLKSFLGHFSTGRQTDKDFTAWKKSFANEMYFVPSIDDTPGFWESYPAWWNYWGDLIDGASVWESAWPEVHGTNEGGLSRDIKAMGPLQKKGKRL
ncbi:hypothetical protein BFJ68_g15358 [Fusarium oxysporum]|uniref:Uncharacterized protein n=1 Tax=Fusarium oxysporum TaxID=5507 RepID=A0A420PN13_FUSOX|nr:hypothetical protein BFJ71_g11270 [Fusarium oxysporum]RKK93881.1 hypothetical protein BFJ68_g15358 [Fusarium oxysporum]